MHFLGLTDVLKCYDYQKNIAKFRCHLKTTLQPCLSTIPPGVSINLMVSLVRSGGRAVECRTVNRGDDGSILSPFRNLGNFILLTFPVTFGRDTKSRWFLLSGVYTRGRKRSHTGGKCITCSGLINSREGQL